MNKQNTHAQNNHILRAGNDRRFYKMEREVSEDAKEINKRKPYEADGKEKYEKRN